MYRFLSFIFINPREQGGRSGKRKRRLWREPSSSNLVSIFYFKRCTVQGINGKSGLYNEHTSAELFLLDIRGSVTKEEFKNL